MQRSFPLPLVRRHITGATLRLALVASAACIGFAMPLTLPVSAAPEAPVAAAVAPVVHVWTRESATDLLNAIEAAGREGLTPADYDPAALRAAIDGGDGAELDRVAAVAGLALARDYRRGRVTDRETFDWHIEQAASDDRRLPEQLADAAANGRVRPWIESLLPSDARYAALREALAATPAPDVETRDRLRANMERWRWMPRDLGEKYIYVNVPSYRLDVVDNGATMSTYDVVVGAPETPTPQLMAPASKMVVNPAWYVPESIVKSSGLQAGRKYAARPGGGLMQKPGPGNALGKIKIDMANAHAIYLHDTPAKGGFTRMERTLSHGCIRVKDIDQLAAELLMHGDGDIAALDGAMAGEETRTIAMGRAWPVYLVYFTADRGDDGGIVTYADPYGRDRKLIAGLDGRMTVASR